jgi:predicted nucleic acid-binding protein
MRAAILDTNVYIGHWERALYQDRWDDLHRTYIVRQSAVVLSELRRGARSQATRSLVEGLRRTAAFVWEPTASDWWEAGRVVQQIGDAKGWDRGKRRDFQNDALIALTARRRGATVVTTDQADFELLVRALRISVLPLA